VVIDAIDAALEDGPNGFDAVGRDAIASVFASLMVDRLVTITEMAQAAEPLLMSSGTC